MVDAGVLENPKVDAVFGLHLIPAFPVGTIGYRSGPSSPRATPSR
jgi:amidohydrolase